MQYHIWWAKIRKKSLLNINWIILHNKPFKMFIANTSFWLSSECYPVKSGHRLILVSCRWHRKHRIPVYLTSFRPHHVVCINNWICRRHADFWSHPGHYPVHPPTLSCLPKYHTHGHELSTHINFLPCLSALPSLILGIFKLWPWNCKVDVLGVAKAQGHTVDPVSVRFVFFYFVSQQLDNNSWDTANSKFDLEKSKVKVTAEIKGKGYIVHPVSNRCISFLLHVTRTIHSWYMPNREFDLEKHIWNFDQTNS